MKPSKSVIDKVGSLRQIAGTRHCRLTDGASDNLRVIDVNTGGGLQYTVLPDRGMDISFASFKGMNLTYLSMQEEINAAYYEAGDNGWLRTFFGGLLTTCGPLSFGPACVDGDEKLGLHGRMNIIPATKICDLTDVEQGKIEITGRVCQSVLFGEKVEVKRSIMSMVGERQICITDCVTNLGDTPVPYMMLYHINFGYPLLDEDVQIKVDSISCMGCEEQSQKAIGEIERFESPQTRNTELNYLHTMQQNTKGRASIVNNRLGMGVEIRFDTNCLRYLIQWKYARARDYVLALEPCNVPCKSRKELRESGALPFLQSGEQVVNRVEIEINEF